MKGFLILLLLLLGILLLAIGLFKAARWSGKKNVELKAKNKDSQEQALSKLLNGEKLKESVASYFASSLPRPISFIGKILTIVVILFFVFLALLAAYSFWSRI